MLKIDLTKILSIIKKILFCINNVLGKYILVTLLLSIGLYLSIYFKLPYLKIFQAKKSESLKGGVDKKKLFWVMLGGSVGLGNLIFITSAVLTGGPLTLVFLFIGTFMGLILQYSDIYLSI